MNDKNFDKNIEKMISYVSEQQTPLPPNFSRELHNKLVAASQEMTQPRKKSWVEKMLAARGILAGAVCLLLISTVFISGDFERTDPLRRDPSLIFQPNNQNINMQHIQDAQPILLPDGTMGVQVFNHDTGEYDVFTMPEMTMGDDGYYVLPDDFPFNIIFDENRHVVSETDTNETAPTILSNEDRERLLDLFASALQDTRGGPRSVTVQEQPQDSPHQVQTEPEQVERPEPEQQVEPAITESQINSQTTPATEPVHFPVNPIVPSGVQRIVIPAVPGRDPLGHSARTNTASADVSAVSHAAPLARGVEFAAPFDAVTAMTADIDIVFSNITNVYQLSGDDAARVLSTLGITGSVRQITLTRDEFDRLPREIMQRNFLGTSESLDSVPMDTRHRIEFVN